MRSFWQEMRGGFAALRPEHFPYARFIAALILGFIGGAIFNALTLPLPWMLGPMTFCTIAAILRAPIAAPTVVRPPMSAVIGVMLGAAFTPAILTNLLDWVPTIIGLAFFVAVSGSACVLYFRKIGRMDMTTAYFAGMPGGLVEMVVVGEQRGGDGRTIALVHSARILLVVMTLPFLVELVEGVSLGGRADMGPSVTEAPLTAELWIIGCGLAGAVFGHLLRLPAKYLLGPMLVSAFVHAAGITDFKPPAEIVQGAQIVLGVTIGCRFLGTPPQVILRILALSFGSTMILLVMTLGFAVIVSRFSAFEVLPLMLAYSPGGLAEMSLVAIAVHTEVAFVAAHHIIRILFVMLSAGPTFALLYPKRGGKGGGKGVGKGVGKGGIPRMRDG